MSPTLKKSGLLGLYFEACYDGVSKLIAHLPVGDGAMVVFTAIRSADDMPKTGWYLVKLTYAEDSKIALADPILTSDNLEASRDLLANVLDFGHEIHTDDKPSKPNDIAILCFNEVGDGPLKAELTLPTGKVDVFPATEFEEFMDDPGWYMCRLKFTSPDTAFATPVMTEENVLAARELLDGYRQMESLRQRLQLPPRLSLVPSAAAAQ